MTLHIKANDFEIFLKNSQNIFIKKLLIKNNLSNDILPHIKKYIMKKKRIEYLAIMSTYGDLFSLDDEVKEFKLHNIKVQEYDDLYDKTYDFIKKLD